MNIGHRFKRLLDRCATPSPDASPASDWGLRLARSNQPVEWLVLGLGVLLSLGLAALLQQEDRISAQHAFDQAVQRSESELLARFSLPVHGLRGLRGAFANAAEPLSRAQFAHYIASRDLPGEFPGTLGITFVQRVLRRDLDTFLADVRADAAPDFALRSFGNSNHDDLYVVKYIAPLAHNTAALGFDIGSDPTRRRAAEQAVRSGEPTMTEGVMLVLDHERKQPGVLISVPVYANAAPLETPEQRQAALIGLLNAPAVVASLLETRGDIGYGELHIRLLGPTAPTGPGILWYDNRAAAPGSAAAPRYQTRIPLNLYGQQLELQIASTPGFERMYLSSVDWWVTIIGVLLSAGAALWLSRHLRVLRRADSELEQTQRKLDDYRQLAGQTHSAFVTTDMAGRITSVSSGFEQLTGYTKDEALGQRPGWLLQCEETAPDQILRIREALRSNGYYAGEILNRSKQGRLYWVDLCIQPHFNSQGQQIGHISSSIDVTQRRQSQMLLQEAEQSNRNLLEALNHNAIVSVTDLDGVIQRANDGFCRISGYSQEELVGKRHNIVNARADNVVDWGSVWQTIRGGQVWRGEVCNRAKSGRLYWVDTVIVPFFCATGEVNSYVSVRFDITQLKLAQARAEEQTALLEGAIATIGQAFCIYDADDRLVYFNDQYRQVYATSAEKIMVGETFEAIVRFGAENGQYPQAIGHIDEWVAERIAFHQRGDGELVQHLDDGRILRIVERRMPSGYVVGFRIDITDMVKAKEAAQAGERAKSQFLANMSHEIRTPMNAVLGMLALLRKTPMTAQQSDYAGKAERAGKSLLGLLNDILDLSKINAGMMVLEQRPFQIEHVLRNLAEIFASTLVSPRVELLLDLDPRATASVIGDSLRLHQILLNLGSNAIKFTEEGHVLIGVKVVERNATHLRLLFEVRDTGIGMDASFQRVIFEAFTQAQQSTTRQYGGTGLGMAITSQLVKFMGSELQVESELGRGSRFFFEADLPLDPATPARLPDTTRYDRYGNDLNVLLVDDHRQSLELLEQMCRSLGWHATVCDSGAAALVLLHDAAQQDHCYDVVFMDCQMPGLSGLQTCVQLRERDHNTPVVMMATLQCLESPPPPGIDIANLIDGQIMKPVTASMLYDAAVNLHGHGEQAAKPFLLPSQAMDDAPLAGLHILVAEDNLVNQQLARELLMNEGAEVDIAANGQIAVEMVQAAHPAYDMVLMDMQMPVMDGLEATRQIRAFLGPLELPIVAMTANAMSDDRQACLDAGMNEHVAKPLDMDELVDTILQQARPRQAGVLSGALAVAAT